MNCPKCGKDLMKEERPVFNSLLCRDCFAENHRKEVNKIIEQCRLNEKLKPIPSGKPLKEKI